MEFKPSPFSFLPFSSVPEAVSTFPLSLQLLLCVGGCFSHTLPPPHLRPLSPSKNSSLPSMAFLNPSSPLHTAYLLSSVVQVVQIVVLILKLVF